MAKKPAKPARKSPAKPSRKPAAQGGSRRRQGVEAPADRANRRQTG